MELQQFIDVAIFTKEIDTEINDLTEAMRTQTARAAYYGIQHSQAKRQKGRVDLTVKSVEAMLMKKYRKEMEDAALAEVEGTNKAPTRVTADMVKASVATDPNMLKYLQLQLDADEIESICRVAYDAFRTRREMLSSLGHLTSAQLKSNMTIQGAKDAAASYHPRRQQRDPAYTPPISQAAQA